MTKLNMMQLWDSLQSQMSSLSLTKRGKADVKIGFIKKVNLSFSLHSAKISGDDLIYTGVS